MKCVHCNKEIDTEFGMMEVHYINIDGDAVCSLECKRKYEKERDHFFNVTIHDDEKYNAWMGF